MKEQDTRSANIQSKETSHISNQIGNILVTAEYENENVCLILDNRDEKAESITISYEESHKLGIKTLEETLNCSVIVNEKCYYQKDLRNGKNSTLK